MSKKPLSELTAPLLGGSSTKKTSSDGNIQGLRALTDFVFTDHVGDDPAAA